jgi:glutamate/aspartate transport system ATP-binding protein
MDAGSIVEKSDKDAFFNRPQSERARDFLEKILV